MSKFVAILGLFAILGTIEPISAVDVDSDFVDPFKTLLKGFDRVTTTKLTEQYNDCLKKYEGMIVTNVVTICVQSTAHSMGVIARDNIINKSIEQRKEIAAAFQKYLTVTEPKCVQKYVPLGGKLYEWVANLKEIALDVEIDGAPIFPPLYLLGMKRT